MIRCSRCNRKLKNPIYIENLPYGKICIKKIKEEIKRLKIETETKTEIKGIFDYLIRGDN